MVVEKVQRRCRSNFYGLFKCEHCGSISYGQGYSDGYYYHNVLPFCKCPSCGLQSIKGDENISYGGFELVEKKELPEGYKMPEGYFAEEPEEEGWKECEQNDGKPWLYWRLVSYSSENNQQLSERATADFLSIKIKYLMINDKTIAFYIMLWYTVSVEKGEILWQ